MNIEIEILKLIEPNQEEYKHTKDALKWLLKIKPDADLGLRIAILGHDIERAIKPWVNEKNIHTKEFREKHTERSAEIIKTLLEKYKFSKEEIGRAHNLILNHEFGGNSEEDLIRDADSLSNFEWCDDFFGIREFEELKKVAKKMYERMSKENRRFIEQIKFKNKEIEEIIKSLEIKNYLSNLGIKFKTHTHPAVFTCEEADKYCQNIPGIHSKNLLLKTKKTNTFYLAILPDTKKLNLKELKQKYKEDFTFAEDKDLQDLLGVKTGAVSPFTLINDKDSKVVLLIDKEISESPLVSFHPNINTETLELTQDDFQVFLKSLKNKVEEL